MPDRSGHSSLGMDRAIDRRDFIGGVAAATVAAGSAVGGLAQSAGAAPLEPGYYPPAKEGLRGSHPGSFESAHALRDAKSWDEMRRAAIDTGESYDLIVVGGGISGLAAAYFYRQRHGASARILILDNHDDFGGHAKRNEFTHNGRTYIGYGGTEQIYHGPWEYGPEALGLIKDIGIQTDRFYTAFDWTRYQRMRLGDALFFDKETFGRDHLAVGENEIPWAEFLAATPLSAKAQGDIVQLYSQSVDYMPGLSQDEKVRQLGAMSYNDFLLNVAKVDPSVVPYFRTRTERGTSPTDYVRALNARNNGILPGLEGMGLPAPRRRWKRDPEEIFHFPDGNAGVARLLVRSLIPAAMIARDMEQSVTARVDYSEIDAPASPVRLRVSSTVVNARHMGAPDAAKAVEVTYLNGGKGYRARAGHVVLACYNAIIPMICPDLPEKQKIGLSHAVKSPLIYTNVLVSNWRAWEKLGTSYIYALNAYYTDNKLDFPVDMGAYKASASPDEPIVLHLEKRFWDLQPRAWEHATMTSRAERNKMGRYQLLATDFAFQERQVREGLGRMLGPGGFDPARDILGITVNRWPHGYAIGRDDGADPEYATEEDRPWVIGRKPYGRITIANSDAGAGALTQVAIDQAWRAVSELS